MAVCEQCGKEIRDDAWVCGLCGAPVAYGGGGSDSSSQYEYAAANTGSGDYSSSQYVPGAPVLAASPKARSGRSAQMVWIAGIGGLVAVLAVVAVWFFVLRGPVTGTSIAGTWRTPTDDKTELIITAKAGGYELSIANKDGKQIGPFSTQMVSGSLTTSFEAASGSDANQQAAAALFKQIMGSIYQGFTMAFSYRASDDKLLASVQGVPAAASQQEVLDRVR
jgi:hypothetical protein